uniref:Calponin-homology (CH) domain-containing protein n=1 Tax=Elaeophora elaphi TaxID=1147741 RepID=A0A0R3RU62_9BILA
MKDTVNYRLLDWAQQLAIEEEDKRQVLPGKSDAVTKNQFLSFLRDGSLLAKLANRLQPGTIETIHEGEAAKDKTNQASNINAFINFAKEKAGLSEEQIFTTADLQEKGKAGYQAVFNTLMQLALKAQSIFEQKGIDVEQLIQAASQVVPTNLLQTILNFFRRAQPAQTPKKLAKEAEEKDKTTAVEKTVEEKHMEEEVCKKVDTQAGNIDTPAVAVH